MAKVTSRLELIDYCFRRLGWPVIEINVDLDQVEDRIDDAFQIYFDYHYDGVERVYHAHQITQTDLDNSSIPIPDEIISVICVLSNNNAGGGGLFHPMGDPSLAWNSTSANPIFNSGVSSGSYTSGTSDRAGGDVSEFSMSNFYMNMTQFQLFSDMFGGSYIPISYSRHTNIVNIDGGMDQLFNVDDYAVIEGYKTLDPETYNDVYNDRWLKQYTTALIKRQWSENLKKYSGISLPGGVTLDGDKLYLEATTEINQLEEELQSKYEEPPRFFMG